MDQTPPEGERRKSWHPSIRPHILELDDAQFESYAAKLYQDVQSGRMSQSEFQQEIAMIKREIKNTDPTTKLLNQEGIKEELGLAIEQAKINGLSLSVLFIDGDHFKEINDMLGHDQGDQAILAMAAAIRKADPRTTDIKARPYEEAHDEETQASRHGGDEFVVILPGTNLWGASRVADIIRQNISQFVTAQVKDYLKTFGHAFTASIGIAEFDPHIDHTAENLIRRADQNLMQVRDEVDRNKRS